MTAAFLLLAFAASGTTSLQSVLDTIRASQDVPGVSAIVVRHGETLFAGGSGLADIESADAMTADSVLYIGSVSKVFTAALTLQLVEAEQLSLNDPVAGIAPHASATPVTVANLLTHSAGLSREGEFGYWFSADFPDKQELAHYIATSSLRSVPGSASHYSNIGYAALGLLIERTTGKSYSEALRDNILTPLNMSGSGAPGPARSIAKGYTPANRIIPSPERPFAGVGKRVGNRHEREYHDAQAMSPAFGAYASANDMGRFARFLLGYGHDDVLSPAMRDLMQKDQLSGRGFGLRVQRLSGRTIARHDGWFAAHRTHLLLDIDNSIGIVVLANSDSANPGKIAEALLEAALVAISKSGRQH